MIWNRAIPRPRPPAVAGSFYPQSTQTLRRTVDDLFSSVAVQERSGNCGIIAPHAGYAYSGRVAAAAFGSLRCCSWIKRAVVIGPAHFVPFLGIAAPSDAAFTTPLGEVPVDVAAVKALSEETIVVIKDEPHAPEHARGGAAVPAVGLRRFADRAIVVRVHIGCRGCGSNRPGLDR